MTNHEMPYNARDAVVYAEELLSSKNVYLSAHGIGFMRDFLGYELEIGERKAFQEKKNEFDVLPPCLRGLFEKFDGAKAIVDKKHVSQGKVLIDAAEFEYLSGTLKENTFDYVLREKISDNVSREKARGEIKKYFFEFVQAYRNGVIGSKAGQQGLSLIQRVKRLMQGN